MNAAGPLSRKLAPVFLVTVVAVVIVTLVHQALTPQIAEGRRRLEMQPVLDALPLKFDNDLLDDQTVLADLPQEKPATVFRARHDGQAVGVVVMPVVATGYNGDVELAVGIARDGTLTGVRVTRQAETVGLGDQVHQDNSGWVKQFPGRSLENTPAGDWLVSADGGKFDGISGATITPRGILRAVRGLIERHQTDPDSFYR
jgi:Na+-translocating ferredoxin:NAD+ oxidoreductase subunit G